MSQIAPAGSVYQAGTLSGNPLAMTAGIATLEVLKQPIWEKMELAVNTLAKGINQAARHAGVPIQQTTVGTMFSTFFTKSEVRDWPTVKTCDTEFFGKFFHKMLEQGVYLAPSQFEASFISSVHTEEIIEQTIAASKKALTALA